MVTRPVWPTGRSSVRRPGAGVEFRAPPSPAAGRVSSRRLRRWSGASAGFVVPARARGELELGAWVLQRAERDDLAFEQAREGPFGQDPGLAVEGRHPAEVVGAVHEPRRVAPQLAPVDMGDAL